MKRHPTLLLVIADRIGFALKGLLLAVFAAITTITTLGQSALDGFDPAVTYANHEGAVYAYVVQPDGKIIIGGLFDKITGRGAIVNKRFLARLNPDGSVDQSFRIEPDFIVQALVLQPDGKLLVGGHFLSIGGQNRRYLARLDPVTGTVDTFNPGPSGPIYEVVLQPDQKILISGSFLTVGGVSRRYFARLQSSGVLDSFNPAADAPVGPMALQSDGKVILGGSFGQIGGQQRNGIARFDGITGQIDSFDPNVNGVSSLYVQPDGMILIGGGFTFVGGQPRNRMARVDRDRPAGFIRSEYLLSRLYWYIWLRLRNFDAVRRAHSDRRLFSHGWKPVAI